LYSNPGVGLGVKIGRPAIYLGRDLVLFYVIQGGVQGMASQKLKKLAKSLRTRQRMASDQPFDRG
jgi:hypothetical protein